MLDDLVDVIETLKARIASHRDALGGNEYRTRVSLIDPLLGALGWHTADPEVVRLEYGTDSVIESDDQVDYALLQEGVPLVLVEAKRGSRNLDNRKYFKQLFDYFGKTPSAKIGILTNGIQYRFYSDLKYTNVLHSKPFLEIDVTNLSPGEKEILECFSREKYNLEKAIRLSRELGEEYMEDSRISDRGNNAVPMRKKVTGIPAVPPVSVDGWTPLNKIVPYSKMPPPSAVKLPDGTVVGIPNWKQVFVEVAEYLVRHGILTSDRCPISPLKSFGIHTQPYHPAATRQLSNGLYWRCFGGAASVKRNTTKLMDVLGQDPSQLRLKTR